VISKWLYHFITLTVFGFCKIHDCLNCLLQVRWQETLRGHVAGILTTQRVFIVTPDLEILASSYSKFDKGHPPISFDNWPYSFMFQILLAK